MSEAPPLPVRPRLASHALARRHLIDGVECVVLHDTRGGDLIRLGTREWSILAEADGTRDFDGLCLAAARVGAYRRASEIRAFLGELHAAGLLEDGLQYALPESAVDLTTPLDALPDYGLSCDASGACCEMYGSVVFSRAEAVRARAFLPLVLGAGEDETRAFTPAEGSRAEGLAVAMVNGRCAYLAESGLCGIHEIGGERAKPRPCRTFPMTFVDDGEAVRISVGPECACVFASAGRPGGSPLLPEGAHTRGDLEPGTRVVRLADRIALTTGSDVARGALVVWSRTVLARGAPVDSLTAFWSLANAALPDLGTDAATRALNEPRPPSPSELIPFVEALASRAAQRVAATEAWRSPKDRARKTSVWLAEAANAIRDPRAIEAILSGPRDAAAEAFYFRATLHGHHLVDEVPLERALRDRAVRLLVARALGPIMAERASKDPSASQPLALVEAMMRAHGVKAYAREIAVP